MVEKSKLWSGIRVRSNRTGELYIQTKDCDWSLRFGHWKANYLECPDIPCPMPERHGMFRKGSSSHTRVEA